MLLCPLSSSKISSATWATSLYKFPPFKLFYNLLYRFICIRYSFIHKFIFLKDKKIQLNSGNFNGSDDCLLVLFHFYFLEDCAQSKCFSTHSSECFKSSSQLFYDNNINLKNCNPWCIRKSWTEIKKAFCLIENGVIVNFLKQGKEQQIFVNLPGHSKYCSP